MIYQFRPGYNFWRPCVSHLLSNVNTWSPKQNGLFNEKILNMLLKSLNEKIINCSYGLKLFFAELKKKKKIQSIKNFIALSTCNFPTMYISVVKGLQLP